MERARVVLKRGKAGPLWHGHPWVFSGAIERTDGPEEPGALADVCDIEGHLIGRGFLNPRSQIRVRMLTARDEPLDPERPAAVAEAVPALLARRIAQAARLRRRIGLPAPETSAFRLVNSEGDGLSGLVIDLYDRVAAVQFGALAMKRNEEAIYDALLALPEEVRPAAIAEVAAGGFAKLEGFSSAARVVRGEAAMPVPCREAGVELRVDVLAGQKTGMFLDQRDNRVRLGSYAGGARVLDLYSYAGGFALQALRQGAGSALCVDASARALAQAQNNARASGLSGLEVLEADAFRYLETAAPHGFEVVVVDPPKFARAQKDLPSAMKGYRRLNALALQAVAPGGLLATCSCSQLVDQEGFERMVASAAQDAGRSVTVLLSASQGPDHPLPPAFPEGRYLKFLLLGVGR